jgi:hypothetical protein
VRVISHLSGVSRLRMGGALHPLSLASSWPELLSPSLSPLPSLSLSLPIYIYIYIVIIILRHQFGNLIVIRLSYCRFHITVLIIF